MSTKHTREDPADILSLLCLTRRFYVHFRGDRAAYRRGSLRLIDVVLAEPDSLRVATGVLNEIMAEAVAHAAAALGQGKTLKLYYITQVAVKPPTFVIFVNDKN